MASQSAKITFIAPKYEASKDKPHYRDKLNTMLSRAKQHVSRAAVSM